MVIFHSYVKFPDGNVWDEFSMSEVGLFDGTSTKASEILRLGTPQRKKWSSTSNT